MVKINYKFKKALNYKNQKKYSMEKYTIQPIGYVKNPFNEVVKMPEISKVTSGVSVIEVLEEYAEGLYKVEEQEFLNIIFYFNKSEGYEFLCNTPMGEQRGVFACRSPRRPNALGTTTVKLIKREGNRLFVTGFDAINDTPIIDIKNANTPILETSRTYIPRYQANPRIDIETLLDKKDFKALLIKSAQLHNHFCPGLTHGVLAATLGMIEFKKFFGDYKPVHATVTTTSCFMDGAQFVSGSTLANHGLTIKDEQISSVIFSRKGKERAVKVSLKESSKNFMVENYPEFTKLRESLFQEGVQNTPETMANFRAMALETAFKMVENEQVEGIFQVEEILSPIAEKV